MTEVYVYMNESSVPSKQSGCVVQPIRYKTAPSIPVAQTKHIKMAAKHHLTKQQIQSVNYKGNIN